MGKNECKNLKILFYGHAFAWGKLEREVLKRETPWSKLELLRRMHAILCESFDEERQRIEEQP